jgi:tetratricopeptide (TPR) repeat protein
VETNAWKRPIYYAVTVAPENFIGFTPYLQMQGLALQLTPKINSPQGGDYEINLPIMKECLMEPQKEISTEPQYGFVFNNLNNAHAFYDDNVRNLMVNYRYSYLRLAAYYQMHGDSVNAVAALDTMESRIPNRVLPIKYEILSDIARLYYMSGAMPQFHKFADIVVQDALAAIEENPNDVQRYYNPYRILLDIYDMEKDYQKSIDLLEKLETMFPSDRSIPQRISQLQVMMNMKTVPPSPYTASPK